LDARLCSVVGRIMSLSDTVARLAPAKLQIAFRMSCIEYKYSVCLSTERCVALDVSGEDKTVGVDDTVPVRAILPATNELRILELNSVTKIDQTVRIAHGEILDVDGFFYVDRDAGGYFDA